MKTKLDSIIGWFATFAVLLAVVPSSATAISTPIPAVRLSGFGQSFQQNDFTDGWRFSVSDPILVTSLGFQDVGGDGLANGHLVGIWTDSGTLLVQANVTPGSPLGLDNFRYESIAPLLLAQGIYRIGAQMGRPDPLGVTATNFSTAAGITHLGRAESGTNGFAFPNSLNPGPASFEPGFFGPNFQFVDSIAVPEPSSLTLLAAISFVGIGASSRTRRNQRFA